MNDRNWGGPRKNSGRPKSKNKKAVLSIRLTNLTIKKIKAKAKALGLSTGEFVEKLVNRELL